MNRTTEHTLSTELLLQAYSNGFFPMADPAEDDHISWYAPDPRAILPLKGFHISTSLRRVIRANTFGVTTNTAFERVMRECARATPGRESTWISEEIIQAYTRLHEDGFAHSVESWKDGELAGGLYGVAIGGAFFGESMFSRVSNASKVALSHLVERLNAGGFSLLDTQFITPHLARLGAIEIPKEQYLHHLHHAVATDTEWLAIDNTV